MRCTQGSKCVGVSVGVSIAATRLSGQTPLPMYSPRTRHKKIEEEAGILDTERLLYPTSAAYSSRAGCSSRARGKLRAPGSFGPSTGPIAYERHDIAIRKRSEIRQPR